MSSSSSGSGASAIVSCADDGAISTLLDQKLEIINMFMPLSFASDGWNVERNEKSLSGPAEEHVSLSFTNKILLIPTFY